MSISDIQASPLSSAAAAMLRGSQGRSPDEMIEQSTNTVAFALIAALPTAMVPRLLALEDPDGNLFCVVQKSAEI
jgi:hypothetical protein